MSDRPAPTDPAQLRRDYRRAALRRADLAADPVAQFRLWFDQAVAAELSEPNAMVLGTSDGTRPSARTVLLKAFDGRGFVFFTHYESRKATEIAAHPEVSLLFPWYGLERQVAILGRAERISAGESLAYFLSRPLGSRMGAWVSQQSAVIRSRSILEAQWQAMQHRFASGEVPLPPAWGGLRVVPFEFEFWQGRENRLHDRFRYRPNGDGAGGLWSIERLAP
ncbi:pyridoxamine 5'-phosphate oxidase [Synechococcus sp. BSF8S]|uniref:pyridoxamine 5'-phosphate oxidase n=1 Tax=Synechococcales TaxID=1890424 RepID=UPI001628951B|nr:MULTISPECIES: pyridoxamine 5'-phosphate oxidase [unclassified Synechococcus]MBC1261989.1 pyridoxamine 5'-phosphate oxidase [Synechococcus sp. BSF8S]MBC1264916.1 pyridoxamine 5'-phosphate oxidase [Synechococcus sp. BSA11S]